MVAWFFIAVKLSYTVSMNYWIMKSEPDAYPWERLVREKRTHWDGIRNYQARNNMGLMKVGDLVLFYHSGDERRVVGVARIVREAYPDFTAPEGDARWTMVDIVPVKPFRESVDLATIKEVPELSETRLVRQSRLSVSSLTRKEFEMILRLGKTKVEV